MLGTLAGAALAVGACRRDARHGTDASDEAGIDPEVWIAIGEDDSIVVRLPRLEMGQGIQTTIALLVAEELAVAPERLSWRWPSTADVPRNGRELSTSGSASTQRLWLPFRNIAAAVREMLVAAAAARWRVPASECVAVDGEVRHAASGASARYGELAKAAARLPVPAEPTLTARPAFRLLGRPRRRVDGREIAAGTARYAADVRLPGQRVAVVARPPRIGAVLERFDATATRAVAGVTDVVALPSGVAIVAEETWAALVGRERLDVAWRPGPGSDFSSAALDTELASALDVGLRRRFRGWRQGAHEAVLAAAVGEAPQKVLGEPTLVAEYSTPFQTHVPMEPWNAVAKLESGRCEIWCGHQHPYRVIRAVARDLALDERDVVVHTQRMGGGFGSRETAIYPLEAARLAAALPGRPVQVVWTREDDLRHALFHPPTRHRLAGWLGRRREIAGWSHRIAAPAVEPRVGKQGFEIVIAETSGASNLVYAVPHRRVEYAAPRVPVELGFWRGIEIASNVFAVESFLDELAHAAGRDPVAMRLDQLVDRVESPGANEPFDVARLRPTIELAARVGDWGSALGPGRGRGFAACVFDGRSAVATVAEVTVADGELAIDRVVCAMDCGFVVNPLGLESNAEGAVAWGLSALSSEITFAAGAVEQSSHLDYPILRLPQMPRVEIHTVPSDAPPSGSGEIPVPTIAPAVTNAVFAACGVRLRRLPIRPGDLP